MKMPKRTVQGDGKKSPLNMRTTPELRRRLEKAAAVSGRSLVQETEFRLEKSFAEEEFNRLAILSPATFRLAGQIAQAAALAEAISGDSWTENGRARQALKAAIQELIEPTNSVERDNSDRRRTLADAVLIVAGKKSGFNEPNFDLIGRHIADAIARPRMGNLPDAEDKSKADQ
jgi:hypothetical protein